MAIYATDDFSKSILEGSCLYDGYDTEGNYKVYNKTCKYDKESDTIVEYNTETNLSSSDKYIRYDN